MTLSITVTIKNATLGIMTLDTVILGVANKNIISDCCYAECPGAFSSWHTRHSSQLYLSRQISGPPKETKYIGSQPYVWLTNLLINL
jgi:hypothetical protein